MGQNRMQQRKEGLIVQILVRGPTPRMRLPNDPGTLTVARIQGSLLWLKLHTFENLLIFLEMIGCKKLSPDASLSPQLR